MSLVKSWNTQIGFCKSSSKPFVEPTSTKQWEKSFLLKETTSTFYGVEHTTDRFTN